MSAPPHYFQDQIVNNIPREFFTLIREEYDAAFFEAHRRANEPGKYGEPDLSSVAGYQRHWLCEEAVRKVAREAGIDRVTRATLPFVGQCTLIMPDGFIIGRGKVDHYTAKVKISKSRALLAAMNEFVSSQQPDLFNPSKIVEEARLFGLIISAADRKMPAVPAFINFAVPNHTFDEWIFNQPIETVLSYYTQEERPTEYIPDLANVGLKKASSQ